MTFHVNLSRANWTKAVQIGPQMKSRSRFLEGIRTSIRGMAVALPAGMQRLSLGKLVVASSTLVLIAACGAATDPASYLSGDGGTITQGSVPSDDAGSDAGKKDGGKKDDAGSMTCGACVTDSDCQKSCKPSAGGGTHCCDVASGLCYGITLSHCPSPVDAGAE